MELDACIVIIEEPLHFSPSFTNRVPFDLSHPTLLCCRSHARSLALTHCTRTTLPSLVSETGSPNYLNLLLYYSLLSAPTFLENKINKSIESWNLIIFFLFFIFSYWIGGLMSHFYFWFHEYLMHSKKTINTY